jgi:hypothetical protein
MKLSQICCRIELILRFEMNWQRYCFLDSFNFNNVSQYEADVEQSMVYLISRSVENIESTFLVELVVVKTYFMNNVVDLLADLHVLISIYWL